MLSGHCIKSDVYEKFKKTDEAMYFFAGAIADIENFIIAHEKQWDKEISIDCSALVVKQGKVYKAGVDNDYGPWKFELTFTEAIGSGQQYVRAFIESGMSPEQAIRKTMEMDAGTGGKIRTYSVEQGEFINGSA